MDIVFLTPVRLFGDGLSECLRGRVGITLKAVVGDLAGLRTALTTIAPDLALIDVTQGVDLFDVRSIAVEYPSVALVALGLVEQRQYVIRCGRAGFMGYVSRDATADQLCNALTDVEAGRLACPAEISCDLLRALFRTESVASDSAHEAALTKRENDVLALIGQGLSNKEIARDLALCVATVKQHVHHILYKMKLQNRAQAMRRVRNAPWLVAAVPSGGDRTSA
jgi:two-component system, NarL family, nitrate/nitrite response regulator NarL